MEEDDIKYVKYKVQDFIEYFIIKYSDGSRSYIDLYNSFVEKIVDIKTRYGVDALKDQIQVQIAKVIEENGHYKEYNNLKVDDVMTEISKHIDNPELLPENAKVTFPHTTKKPLTLKKHLVKIRHGFGFIEKKVTFLKKKLEGKTIDGAGKDSSVTNYYIFEVDGITGKKNLELKEGDVTFIYDEEPVAIEEQSPTKGGKRRKRSTKRKTKKTKKSKKSKRKSKKSKTIRKRH